MKQGITKTPGVSWVLFLVFTFYSISAYSGSLIPLKVAYSTVAEQFLPLFITYESQFFQKYGLDAKIVYISGGSGVVQAMLAGEAPIAVVGASSVIRATLSGADLVMIGNILDKFDLILVTQQDIKSVGQLRGKQIAVGRYGGAPDFAIRHVLRKTGLEPDKDVAIVQIAGGMSGRFGAVVANRVQGAVISPLFAARARELGLRELIDLTKFSPRVEVTGVATSRSFIKNHRNVVDSFMKAFLEGIYIMKTDKEKSVTVLGKYLRMKDLEAMEGAWKFYATQMVQKKPYSTLEGVEFVLSLIATEDPRAKSANPEQFLDTTILERLDKSGFIDQLYK